MESTVLNKQQQVQDQQEQFIQKNTINRYLTAVRVNSLILNNQKATEAWLFRDDIGAPYGVKGYEEQVNTVGWHHGHAHWTCEINWNSFNSATLRRGFKVF
jgi:ubiquinol-cytochrome c reductase cytochrome c1 subunit